MPGGSNKYRGTTSSSARRFSTAATEGVRSAEGTATPRRTWPANLGAQHRWVAASQSALGACLIDVGRAAEGEPLLRESIECFRSSGTLLDAEGRDALAALVRRYEATGRRREASVYREWMRGG
jgi:hypothetical protein